MNIFSMDDELMPSERVLNAASFGQVEQLTSALAAGGDPNYIRLDVAPTLIAVLRDYTECLQLLVQAGARSDLANRGGWTAIHEAAQKEDGQSLGIILSAPEQVSLLIRDKAGQTVLGAAMAKNCFENAQTLWSLEPSLINQADNTGATPVMWAMQQQNADWLEWCLRRGADLKRTMETGVSALDLVGSWPEGRVLLETVTATVVPESAPISAAPAKTDAVQDVPDEDQPAVVANPFGLGVLKRRAP